MNLTCKIVGHKFEKYFPGSDILHYDSYTKTSEICMRDFCSKRKEAQNEK